MRVMFDDAVEKGELNEFSSHNSTLNNTPSITPQRSRAPSKERRQTDETVSLDLSKTATMVEKPVGYLDQELDAKWMGGVIIACFFTSGMIDAVAFNSWNCFVGMQTGQLFNIFPSLGY